MENSYKKWLEEKVNNARDSLKNKKKFSTDEVFSKAIKAAAETEKAIKKHSA